MRAGTLPEISSQLAPRAGRAVIQSDQLAGVLRGQRANGIGEATHLKMLAAENSPSDMSMGSQVSHCSRGRSAGSARP